MRISASQEGCIFECPDADSAESRARRNLFRSVSGEIEEDGAVAA